MRANTSSKKKMIKLKPQRERSAKKSTHKHIYAQYAPVNTRKVKENRRYTHKETGTNTNNHAPDKKNLWKEPTYDESAGRRLFAR